MRRPTRRKLAIAKMTGSTFSKPPTSSAIPKPWVKAPTSLEPFFLDLERDHFYIVSLDKHDRAFKRRLFTVPLFLNIFLTIVVIYRIYTAIPTYFDLLQQLLGYETSHKVDIREVSKSAAFYVWLRRALMFLADFILVRFVGMWPVNFFLGRDLLSGEGEAGPVGWRRTGGFKDTEVIVRRSRRWDRMVFHKENITGTATTSAIEDVLEEGPDSAHLQDRILPVVSRRYVQSKTGYQMLDKNWDLYFAGMIKAHALVDEGITRLEDYRTSLVVHTECWGWLIWEVWKEHEDGTSEESSKKLQTVKGSFTTLGKENLFFRTIEVIQSEADLPGRFTAERREKAIGKIRQEFEQQELDFDEFWDRVGGIDCMPGLEVTSSCP